ncbi:nuclear transport factor 2 family protein [Phenylobacterium sp.]|jgi:bifunctional aromatase (cyclase/dehydratase)|uniref:nuclear transport factor 2 family protein n=1 Tax=Phenylobacterium sp. TaxID=1871053 RepID=UPI002F3EAE47
MGQRVSTDDYVSIADHFGRYCFHIDSGEADEWAAMFTEDGVFAGPATPQPLAGREALKGFAEATWTAFKGQVRHTAGNLNCVYGASRDEVKAKLYNYVTAWMEGRGPVMAVCDITLVRAGDGWLIRRNAYDLLA